MRMTLFIWSLKILHFIHRRRIITFDSTEFDISPAVTGRVFRHLDIVLNANDLVGTAIYNIVFMSDYLKSIMFHGDETGDEAITPEEDELLQEISEELFSAMQEYYDNYEVENIEMLSRKEDSIFIVTLKNLK